VNSNIKTNCLRRDSSIYLKKIICVTEILESEVEEYSASNRNGSVPCCSGVWTGKKTKLSDTS